MVDWTEEMKRYSYQLAQEKLALLRKVVEERLGKTPQR